MESTQHSTCCTLCVRQRKSWVVVRAVASASSRWESSKKNFRAMNKTGCWTITSIYLDDFFLANFHQVLKQMIPEQFQEEPKFLQRTVRMPTWCQGRKRTQGIHLFTRPLPFPSVCMGVCMYECKYECLSACMYVISVCLYICVDVRT